MRLPLSTLIVIILLAVGCSANISDNPTIPNPPDTDLRQSSSPAPSLSHGRWGCWGIYHLEIARDGSFVNVIPDRTATVRWGYHLNAVKLLEDHPCTDCFRTGNLHVLPNGDVSIDVTLEHPWSDSEDNLYCTGFDVRGVVMFQASQVLPDNELRIRAGLEPRGEHWYGSYYWWSSSKKGDPELMNADGYTSIFAPDRIDNNRFFDLEEGLPIYEYYKGRYSTGDEFGTINAYKHYYTNETRHMFEVGKSATRTYIIRPPSEGPVIKASYAIYAHWAPPSVVPVVDPEIDFPPEANSSLPYEFKVYQTRPFDPDIGDMSGKYSRLLIKSWSCTYNDWGLSIGDILTVETSGGGIYPVPGEPDRYWATSEPDREGAWPTLGLRILNRQDPDTFPGTWPYLVRLKVFHPDDPMKLGDPLSTEWYIAKIEFEENDGH